MRYTHDDDAAYPIKIPQGEECDGLTKRELFAAMAMQGILAGDTDNSFTYPIVALGAVHAADALIIALNRKGTI